MGNIFFVYDTLFLADQTSRKYFTFYVKPKFTRAVDRYLLELFDLFSSIGPNSPNRSEVKESATE